MKINGIEAKLILDYPNYAVDVLGNVWSNKFLVNKVHKNIIVDGWLLLCQQDDGQGYKKIHLRRNNKDRKGYFVHRLVALAFLPNPYNHEMVNHKDSNKHNNVLSNLEWSSRGHNTRESRKFWSKVKELDSRSRRIVEQEYNKFINKVSGLLSDCSQEG